ncbi:MAG: hypothetical protein IKF36_04755 [Bacilli bacterium]|nr:hypothetical protein [Bacilli bacterium]
MKNFEKLVYTYKHRKILDYLAKKYFNSEDVIERLKHHDMDKMYLLLFYDKKDIEKYHRAMSTHHDNELEKTRLDYIEMILDWESARYTKDDKPLNAYDTMYKYYPHLEDKLLPILKEVGLDISTLEKEEDVLEYANTLSNVTEEDIKKELTGYIEEL